MVENLERNMFIAMEIWFEEEGGILVGEFVLWEQVT